MCSDNVFGVLFLGVFQKRTPTHLDVWAIHYTTILSLINVYYPVPNSESGHDRLIIG